MGRLMIGDDIAEMGSLIATGLVRKIVNYQKLHGKKSQCVARSKYSFSPLFWDANYM